MKSVLSCAYSVQAHQSLIYGLLFFQENLGAQPLLYMTPWFLCLFTSLPCWDTVLATWDLLLLDGMAEHIAVFCDMKTIRFKKCHLLRR